MGAKYHNSAALPVFAVVDKGGCTYHAEFLVSWPMSTVHVFFFCSTLLRYCLDG